MSKIGQVVFVICCVVAIGIGFAVTAHCSDAPKKILIFSSDQPHFPGVAIIDQAIRSTMTANSPYRIQFYEESQDSSRIPNDKYEAEFVRLLQRKFEGEKLDLIFMLSTPAAKFLLKHESVLFTDVPKIFITHDPRDLADIDVGNYTTGITGKVELARAVEMMLAQFPETKKVVIVCGSSRLDKFWLAEAQKEFALYTRAVEFAYLTDLTMGQLTQDLSVLPKNNIVLYLSFTRDSAGETYTLPEGVAKVSPTSSVPLYSMADPSMGAGVVGGNMLSYKALGIAAAETGQRILSGEEVKSVPPRTVQPVNIFDWRQLQKWGIDEDKLPYGSIIQFKEPTFWEQYKWQAIGVTTLTVFQTLLIGWLLFIRARRKQAVRESLRFAALAEAEHERLDGVVSNVPGVVWESRLEPGTNMRKAQFVSAYAEQMLGYSVDEWLSSPGFAQAIIPEEDRESVVRNVEEIFATGEGGVLQFRWVAKDGRVLWVESHIAVIHDVDGKPVGLRGVTMDITDRKLAADKLRSRELELTEAQRLSQTGSWEWDPKSDTVTWSEELYRIAGLDPLMPAPNFEQHKKLYTPESFERLASVVAVALETGTPYELELEMIRSDKRHIWTSARGEVIRDEDSKVVRLRGTLQDINARKRAEEALSESEERYRNVVETQTELICRYLPDTTLTFVNDAYCRYFGKTREELIGTKFVDLIPSHARSTALRHVVSLIDNPRTETCEHEVILPNGGRGWQQWIDRAVEMPNGGPGELQGIGRDITEKRQAEEELRASENRFRTMADSAPLLIWMCGPDKLCTYVNQGWLDFTGRSIDMELGSGWTVGIHSEDADHTLEAFDSAFDRREPFKLEYRLRRADGVFRWVYDSGTPRFSSEGEFLGYIGSCIDISDRKEAEEESRKAHEEVKQLQKQLHEENIYLKEVIKLEHNFQEIVGQSDALKYVLFKIEQVAPTDTTVLITGETGTGKELVARAIHSASLRKNRPLVTVNCAALSASLIESELFGHERGSFTGASARKIGRFELANGATIFLDEIGELPLELQVKLLRVIQEGEFERLGSSKTLKADVRIIAATNRDLEKEVSKGAFREDLLFRLNVFPITVPPLRERRDDIPVLTKYFVDRFSKKLGKNITAVAPRTLRSLCDYAWPGNIRELSNVIERSVIDTPGDSLRVLDLLDAAKPDSGAAASDKTLEAMERSYIIQILEKTGWRVEGANGAARILGLNPSTLRTRIAKLGISRKQDPRNDPYQGASH